MGVDQIVGAKVVNANGEIQDADEELLVGIRGGGGSLGIIVELTIKVYPLSTVRLFLLSKAPANIQDPFLQYHLRIEPSPNDFGILHQLLRESPRDKPTPNPSSTSAFHSRGPKPRSRSNYRSDLAR